MTCFLIVSGLFDMRTSTRVAPSLSGHTVDVNEHLMRAVLWAAVFFETSGDGECDPDLAVKQLEQIAYSLRRLTPDEQAAFRRFALAETERDHPRDLRRLIPSLADALLGEPGAGT